MLNEPRQADIIAMLIVLFPRYLTSCGIMSYFPEKVNPTPQNLLIIEFNLRKVIASSINIIFFNHHVV